MSLSKVNPKYIQLTNHILLLFVAILFFDFARNWGQVMMALGSCVAVDVICFRFWGKGRFIWSERVSSALITGLALLLVVRTPYAWIYGALGVFSIFSKVAFRSPTTGSHIFNPSNFGIATGLILWGNHITFIPDQFSTMSYSIFQTAALGIMVTVMARRWLVSFTYLGIQALMAVILEMPKIIVIGSELGVAGLLSTFFMITDPRTSPESWRQQMAFGGLIGLMALFLKGEGIMLPQFFALFVVSPCWHLGAYLLGGLPLQPHLNRGK